MFVLLATYNTLKFLIHVGTVWILWLFCEEAVFSKLPSANLWNTVLRGSNYLRPLVKLFIHLLSKGRLNQSYHSSHNKWFYNVTPIYFRCSKHRNGRKVANSEKTYYLLKQALYFYDQNHGLPNIKQNQWRFINGVPKINLMLMHSFRTTPSMYIWVSSNQW